MNGPTAPLDPYREAVRHALAYARRSWHVFPLVPGEKRPAITRWEDRATLDPTRIGRCWHRRTSAGPFGVGIACGPSRLVVVDLDQPKPNTVLPDGWRVPGVVDGAPGDIVHGEVWRLRDADATFDWLDEFEGVTRTSGSVTQPDEYTRESRTVSGPEGPVEAWLYMYARDASDLIEVRGGRWSAVTPPGA